MATFISKIQLTDQGMKHIKDTCKRAEDFRSAATGMGAEIKNIYWTMGSCDGLVILEAPDSETATAVMLRLGSAGNTHTETVRAYEASEMNEILAKL